MRLSTTSMAILAAASVCDVASAQRRPDLQLVSVIVGQFPVAGPDPIGPVFTLDLDTAAATQIGQIGASAGISSSSAMGVAGLAYDDNTRTLFGINGTGQLIRVNFEAGTGSNIIGSLVVNTNTTGLNSLAFDLASDTLFSVNAASDTLVSINPTTGAVTTIGAVGFTSVSALTFQPSTGLLFGVDGATDQLIVIDTVTGAGTARGTIQREGTTFTGVTGLTVNPANGQLIAIDNDTNQLLQLSFANGSVLRIVGQSSSFNFQNIEFVPTPGTLALLGLGGLAASRRRRA